MAEAKQVILVVDDESAIREALSEILKDEGYAVVSADCGERALEILQETHIDLVMTDIRMPGIDGIELLKEIRTRHGDVGVIILTAYGQIDSYIEAMNFGAIEYVSKPFRINELRFIVNKVLNNSDEQLKIEN